MHCYVINILPLLRRYLTEFRRYFIDTWPIFHWYSTNAVSTDNKVSVSADSRPTSWPLISQVTDTRSTLKYSLGLFLYM